MRDDLVFLDIDTQRGFMDEDGTLPVPGAREIRGNLRKLTGAALSSGVRILASEDAHPEDDPEFERFGRHCVKGTADALKIDETRVEGHLRVPAGVEMPGSDIALNDAALAARQTVFEKETFDAFSNPALGEVLKALPNARVVVYGVATEYCVAAACRSLLKRDRDTALVTDAVRGVSPEDHERTLAELRGLGVRMTTTDEVLAELESTQS